MEIDLHSFKTERLSAFPLTRRDAPELADMHRNPIAMATLGGVKSDNEANQWLDENLAHWDRHGFGIWIFRDACDGHFVGRGGLREVELGADRELELGYALVDKYWGMGFATEMGREILKIGFNRFRLKSIVALIAAENTRSQRVAEKLGFHFEREVNWKGLPTGLYRLESKDWTGNRMPEKVDLYNTAYGNNETKVYAGLRCETYGVDLGQTSWMNSMELAEIPRLLKLNPSSNALEIGCGAGGCALHFAKAIGCGVTGIDTNANGIHAAQISAQSQALHGRVNFLLHDAGTPLPFSGTAADGIFDAVLSNDAFCYIPNRLQLLRECRRVMKPGARLVFSDALVVNGALTNEEIAARSSIGYYIFVPRGENERLIEEAGFTVIDALDTTQQAADISQRWRNARARRKELLTQIEGEANFEGVQKFLACVHTLTSSHRLARILYVAEK
jgi:RimJ/RimL family protein N-acetyltransferase/ubiquinone/menaquinone biosynthesis C-methylase UbiE